MTRRLARSSSPRSLAGCAVTQPVAAEARPAAGLGDRRAERAARALVDRVQRSGAHRADRRGVRQQPRPARRRSPASRPRARRCCSRNRIWRRSVDLDGNGGALAHFREYVAAAAVRRRSDQQQFQRRAAGVLRARRLGQVPQRACSHRTNDLIASRYFRETVRITVAGDVASAYFRLRAADAELVVLEDTLKLRTDTVKLQRDRFEGGSSASTTCAPRRRSDRRSSPTSRAPTQAIGQLEAAIATLTGRSPRAVFTPEVARGATIEEVTEVPELPAGLPSGLHRAAPRHPPLGSAARGGGPAHPAGARQLFPVAHADRRVRLRIGGAVAACSRGRRRSGASASASCSRCSALKAIEAQVELATARRDETLVEYQQTVQVAFREVHDALVANRASRDVLAAETDRRDQIAKAYEVALLRYDAGRTSFLEVIDAQRQLLAAETLRIARRARRQAVDRRFRQVAGRRLEPGAIRRCALSAAPLSPACSRADACYIVACMATCPGDEQSAPESRQFDYHPLSREDIHEENRRHRRGAVPAGGHRALAQQPPMQDRRARRAFGHRRDVGHQFRQRRQARGEGDQCRGRHPRPQGRVHERRHAIESADREGARAEGRRSRAPTS